MNVLVIGEGGREHSIVMALKESPLITNLYAAPGNSGMEVATVAISATDGVKLVEFAKRNSIDFTVVGPEVPLLEGVVDLFQEAGLAIFGPTKAAALIEGSKAFAKELMEQYNIPTASYKTCTSSEEAKEYVLAQGVPIVVKADGLAAGKGVTVAMTKEDAFQAIDRMMEGDQFGDAGHRVVVEQYLEGEEFSLMAFVNGGRVYPMLPAQDHKRAYDNDEGPNTGGMGAYAPVPFLTEDVIQTAVSSIVQPTAKALVKEGRSFVGVLYAGCIQTVEGPKVIEFNARFGDPETQAILPLLENDLLQVMQDVVRGNDPQLQWKDGWCAGVVLASAGYPGSYEKGMILPRLESEEKTFTIFAGVSQREEQLVSSGGRVLLVGAIGSTLEKALASIYAVYDQAEIGADFFYRKDIGRKAITSSSSSEYK
ncbi:phosphoribosylamine--glycine ligase [Pontibacillus salicampi]|uniref:Phosphoribosylamine--glycine ligase n=1 Tax=Pontibacillus salicampi TaxID=1449801 RepID=A0ABV6LMQ2_9BACI